MIIIGRHASSDILYIHQYNVNLHSPLSWQIIQKLHLKQGISTVCNYTENTLELARIHTHARTHTLTAHTRTHTQNRRWLVLGWLNIKKDHLLCFTAIDIWWVTSGVIIIYSINVSVMHCVKHQSLESSRKFDILFTNSNVNSVVKLVMLTADSMDWNRVYAQVHSKYTLTYFSV